MVFFGFEGIRSPCVDQVRKLVAGSLLGSAVSLHSLDQLQ
jgi:hypothetical protein